MKLIGYLDGIEVRFDFYSPNIFKAEIPKKMSGMYIIELHAVDEAGNQTNLCNTVVLIDFDKLTFKILDKNFIEKVENKNYGFKELHQEYTYKELM
jgi:hypothetical protein